MFTEFGRVWEPRVGDLGAGSPWDAGGITRYTGAAYDHMPTRRRMGLSCVNLSAGVKLLTPLGFGEILVYGEGCLDCLPIEAVAAVWLYDDRPGMGGGTEVDFEHTRWSDPNQPDMVWLGVHYNQVHVLQLRSREEMGHLVAAPAMAYYHWRVRIRTTATEARVAYEGWQPNPGRWLEAAAGLFVAPKTEFSTLRLACWRSGPMQTKSRAPAKFAIAGVEFRPG